MNGLTSKKTDPTDISNIIPPTLIKNYDVFILLKPKDKDDSSNNNSEETNLIDLHTDVSCLTKDLQKLSDTESKKELSVIDLYENITVSPDTLRLQKKSIDREIFDPLELKSLTDDEATAKVTDIHDTHKVLKDLYTSYEHAPTTSNAKDDLHDEFNHKFKQRNDTDDEDLIDDLLSDINHRLVIHKDKQCAYNSKISDAKDLDVPNLIRTRNQIAVPLDNINVLKDVGVTATINKGIKANLANADYKIPELIRTKTNTSISLPICMPKIDIDNTKKIFQVSKPPETQASLLPDSKRDMPKDFGVIRKDNKCDKFNLGNIGKIILPNQTLQDSVSQEETRQYIDKLLQSKTEFCSVLKYYNPIDFYATSHNEYNFIVDTIQMDKKKYKKSRVIVEEKNEKIYTKGPSIDEKKLVLPQIMGRLVEKKKRMDKYAHCNRKLILDCGVRKKEIPVKFNPSVLTEDCNKERLKNLKMRQNFANFVKTGQH